MALDVELELLKDSHWSGKTQLVKGDRWATSPARAEKMINAGWAKKVGVVETEAAEEPVEEEPVAEEPEAVEGDE